MKLSDFDYMLPEQMIAQYPLQKRDQARLMVVNRLTKEIIHDYFFNIEKYIPRKSIFIANDSKVVPARLFGYMEHSGREVEVFLLKALDGGYQYEALLRPLRKIKYGEKIIFNGTMIYAKLIDHQKKIVEFNKKDAMKDLAKIGHMPLPPYIHRGDEPSDRENYQTVYAKHLGSVAAPTAGLHFTKRLLAQLKKSGHKFGKVTLHVNYGTFRPVQEADITKHQMHHEEYAMTKAIADMVKKAKEQKQNIVGVGTTSCRVLETYAKTGELKGNTNLFVYPGFSFKMIDILLTNFHLPKSTLLMLVCAFAETPLVMRAYEEAIKEKYRFYSYGDCMIIQ
ncbi:MAG: tRNA preQ1(34) S-adenosylmethionine ribosyltransferase-isomerase QueA [Candidatus Omnitrophica bacterium]|nr:tRNA preQ1(34) S-adenosylmethionine ribosyltransferase-isomerase QueA [Candidatus Omnitrophota bacterium]